MTVRQSIWRENQASRLSIRVGVDRSTRGQCSEVGNELAKQFEGEDGVTVPDEKLKVARRFFMMRLGVLLARGNAAMVRKVRHRLEEVRV